MSKLVNGQNYFNEDSLNEMIELLENGETIRIYINCIGHTRTAIETSNYINALEKRFGDRLLVSSNDEYSLIKE